MTVTVAVGVGLQIGQRGLLFCEGQRALQPMEGAYAKGASENAGGRLMPKSFKKLETYIQQRFTVND